MDMTNIFGGTERKNSQHLRFEEFVPCSGWTEESDSYCLIIDLPGFKSDQVKLQLDNYGHIVASGERQVNEYKHIRFEQSYKVPENSEIEDTDAKFEDEILYIVIPKKIKTEKEPPHEIINIPQPIQEEKETILNLADKVPEAVSEEEVKKGKDQYTDAAAGSRQESASESESQHHSNEETSDKEKEKCDDNEEKEKKEEFHDAEMEKQRKKSSLAEILGKEVMKNKEILITAILAFALGIFVSQKFQYEKSENS